MNMTRRNYIRTTSGAVAGMSLPGVIRAGELLKPLPEHPICLFSKHLQYLDLHETSEIIAAAGFDGIDLTVRPGGHIEPENVARDLPEAVRIAHAAGLKIPMITSRITDPDDQVSRNVLKVSADNGVKHYRMGSLRYDHSMGIEKNLETFRKVFQKFEAINRESGIHGDYQNHWGDRLGSPVWDLYRVLKGLDPKWIGCQYDIRHAVVEGGGSWRIGMKAISPYITSAAMKDCIWIEENSNWKPQSVPLGTGMVDFKAFFEEFRQLKNLGPVSMHYEYGIGGLKRRDDNLTNDKIIQFYKKDLDELKRRMTK